LFDRLTTALARLDVYSDEALTMAKYLAQGAASEDDETKPVFEAMIALIEKKLEP
jgi:hypothetical protein